MTKWQRAGLAALGGVAVLVLVGVLVRFVLFPSSGAQAGGTILSIVSGQVQVQDKGAAATRPAVDGEELQEGARIVTGDDSRAIITFFDGSTQALDPDTDVTLDHLASTDSGGLFASITQSLGTTWNSVLKPTGSTSDFTVKTPSAVGAARDTLFLVTVDTTGTSEFWSRLGNLFLLAQGQSAEVPSGSSSTTPQGEPPGAPEPKPAAGSEVKLELASAAWMLVVNPDGLAAGILPPGVFVDQIAGTLATDYTQEPQLIDMRDLQEGTYDVYLLGKDSGKYHVSMSGAAKGTLVSQAAFDGTIAPGETWKLELSIDLAGELLASAKLSKPVKTDKAPIVKVIVQDRVLELIAQNLALLPSDLVLSAFSTPAPTATASSVATASPSPTPKPTGVVLAASARPAPTAAPAGTVSGTVVDAVATSAIGGATVEVSGPGLSAATTGAGAFAIPGVPVGGQTLVVSAPGYITQAVPIDVVAGANAPVSISLSPVLHSEDVRIVLTWASEPADLDLHLAGPECNVSGRFHAVWYSPEPVSYARLDVDDTASSGPETATISQRNGAWVAGEYDLWVHNFSGSPEFATSGAVVTVFQGNDQIAQLQVSAEPGVASNTLDIWRVANISIDSAGRVTVGRDQAGFYDDPSAADTVLPALTNSVPFCAP